MGRNQEPSKIKKILVANRGEIAIRILRAANELGIKSVAIYTKEDKLALHRFKADEAYLVGQGLGPVKAYLDIDDIIRIAKLSKADAIHPGYGFLSENPDFAERCAKENIIFIGPKAETMRLLGDKVSARNAAVAAGVPVVPATGALPEDEKQIKKLAKEIGYPLMLKASWGGGGRGMRPIYKESELIKEVTSGRRESEAAFGKDEVYLEKLVERAAHVEVQILGDTHGQIVHLFERDCSVQRRNQKVVERAPAPYLNDQQRQGLCELALKIARYANYQCAGTVEFLMDRDTGAFYFIEVNPRIQVEHTVTEEITGIDIVKAQILISQGAKIGDKAASHVPNQGNISFNGAAMQCRITTEDPQNNFIPDYGRIIAYRGATGFGVRLDGGTAYTDAVITRFYDSLLEKVTVWAPTPEETITRMRRALGEFRIRGVATNLAFVENLLSHKVFEDASYTTRFIDSHPELFSFPPRRDRASLLLDYIADVSVNGHPEARGRPRPDRAIVIPDLPGSIDGAPAPKGTRDLLKDKGPEAVRDWLLKQKKLLITDTTMRDAHQSLLATRMRSFDMVAAAEHYAHHMSDLFSLECWGGATFDVAMRFLNECPWGRLEAISEQVPNICLQMLLRASNGVGYRNYPDNIVENFVAQAATSGVDVFRVFDSLNWSENMKVAIGAVLKSGKLCEAAICYTGDMLDPAQKTYTLDYYLNMARALKAEGAHIIGLKDMAGLLKADAAKVLIKAIKSETGLPVHLHTHDTSGFASATLLAASEAGVDIVDCAMDSFSGLTSQPNLGSLVAGLRHNKRDTGIKSETVRALSDYWEAVRGQYKAFEAGIKSGASEVYLHEMPGGQYSNLKEQARSLGVAERWSDVAKTYADVNDMFGNIVKVTPSSKVVGDMALAMVAAGVSRAEVEDPNKDFAFPDSVVGFMRGDLGQPPNGFPPALQKKVLKGQKPLKKRPGAVLPAANMKKLQTEVEEKLGRDVSDNELASYTMYPEVFVNFAKAQKQYGPVAVLPTPVYFYGMAPGDEITVRFEQGRSSIIHLVAIGDRDEEGMIKIFFELNGQPRRAQVPDRSVAHQIAKRPQAEEGNKAHVAAPMPGVVSSLAVKEGQKVRSGDLLLTIEAMKMETALHAEQSGVIKKIHVSQGGQIDAKDLLMEYDL